MPIPCYPVKSFETWNWLWLIYKSGIRMLVNSWQQWICWRTTLTTMTRYAFKSIRIKKWEGWWSTRWRSSSFHSRTQSRSVVTLMKKHIPTVELMADSDIVSVSLHVQETTEVVVSVYLLPQSRSILSWSFCRICVIETMISQLSKLVRLTLKARCGVILYINMSLVMI